MNEGGASGGNATFTNPGSEGADKIYTEVFGASDVGKRFALTFTVSGTALIFIGTSSGGHDYLNGAGYASYAAGTHTVYITAISGQTTIAFWSGNTSPTYNLSDVSLVRADQGMKLYIDGVEVVSNTTDTSAVNVKNTGAGIFRIGNHSSTYQYGGEIKYTSAHNRALEADEVKGLYNGESTPFVYADASNIVNDTAASDSSSSYGTNSDSTVAHASDHYTLSNNTSSHGAWRYHSFVSG